MNKELCKEIASSRDVKCKRVLQQSQLQIKSIAGKISNVTLRVRLSRMKNNP